MSTKKHNPVYAIASVELSKHGYGHVNIIVHELFGCGRAALKIDCQSGNGIMTGRAPGTYAWQFGLSSEGGIMNPREVNDGNLLLRRISRKLLSQTPSATTFAEYAIRILIAAGVPKVHIRPFEYTGTVRTLDDLPTFNPRRQFDGLFAALEAQENFIISRTT